MTDYTPTTEDVRRAYQEHCRDYDAIDGAATSYESYAEEFDRWLDTIRAEAQVEALREFRQELIAHQLESYGIVLPDIHEVVDDLAESADRIAREAGIETGEKSDD